MVRNVKDRPAKLQVGIGRRRRGSSAALPRRQLVRIRSHRAPAARALVGAGILRSSLLRKCPGQQISNLGLTVAAVAAEGTDRAQLAGFGPPGHRLRVNPEHRRNLCWCQQRLGLRSFRIQCVLLPFCPRWTPAPVAGWWHAHTRRSGRDNADLSDTLQMMLSVRISPFGLSSGAFVRSKRAFWAESVGTFLHPGPLPPLSEPGVRLGGCGQVAR
jgi:hypothetical protein